MWSSCYRRWKFAHNNICPGGFGSRHDAQRSVVRLPRCARALLAGGLSWLHCEYFILKPRGFAPAISQVAAE